MNIAASEKLCGEYTTFVSVFKDTRNGGAIKSFCIRHIVIIAGRIIVAEMQPYKHIALHIISHLWVAEKPKLVVGFYLYPLSRSFAHFDY